MSSSTVLGTDTLKHIRVWFDDVEIGDDDTPLRRGHGAFFTYDITH
jgi:hypothetical protein